MPSGGSRRGAGAKPDPDALRRERNNDRGWMILPRHGYTGETPEYPLPDERDPHNGAINAARKRAELKLWNELWSEKPQAAVWHNLGMQLDVALYVRGSYEAGQPDASAGLRTWVLRAGAELGLTLPGMLALRWAYAEDDIAIRKAQKELEAKTVRKSGGARARLEAIKNA